MLAILTTHPIQYQVPLWQGLSNKSTLPFEVWYMTRHGVSPSFDVEFTRTFRWDLELLAGYPHKYLEVDPRATPTSFWRCRLRESLRHRLRENNVRAILIQGWQVAGFWQAVREANAIGVEVWLRGESNDLAPRSCLTQPLRDARLRWLFSKVDRFFYIGSGNRRLYERFKVSGRLYRAPYAVDNERFDAQAKTLRPIRTQLRRAWNIPEGAFCVLFCGKFIDKKRPLDIVRAAKVVASRVKAPIHILFVGAGPLGGEIRQQCNITFDAEPALVTHDKAGPSASFTGFLNQTNISTAYIAADCLVLPSDHGETWGLVVNEALASGLPCIVSNSCGCAEDLVGNRQSFRCSDINGLAEKLTLAMEGDLEVSQPPSLDLTLQALVKAYEDASRSELAKQNLKAG